MAARPPLEACNMIADRMAGAANPSRGHLWSQTSVLSAGLHAADVIGWGVMG